MDSTSGPAWQRVVRDVASRITSGETPVGSKIGSHQQLALQHATSVGTVKRAIEHLQSRGVLQGVQGAGVFVRQLPDAIDLEFSEHSRDIERIAALEARVQTLENRLALLEDKS